MRAWSFASWGLLFGAGAALLLAASFWLADQAPSFVAFLAAVCAGPAVGFVVGYFWPHDLRTSAAAVDSHYRLKDRASTALEFVSNERSSDAQRLAVEDAMRHLNDVDPTRVVPLKTPQALPYAAGLCLAAGLALFLAPRRSEADVRPVDPLAPVVEAAERAEADLIELEEFAQEEQDEELKKLVEELKKSLEEMKRPDVDLRQALAMMSEMQAALEQRQAELQTSEAEAQLNAVGQALSLAEPLAEAGKALSAGKMEEAAQKLENLEAPALDRQTEKTVKEKLAAIAKQMQESGNASLSKAAGEMSEGLGSDASRFRNGAKGLGGEARKQGAKKRLKDLLMKQCNCLSECKGQCESECTAKAKGRSKGKGGKEWGLATGGDEPGEKTPDLGAKREQRLTGVQSDQGETEIETEHAPEAEQQAQRTYRDSYEKYERLTEEALENEPIPLGHRQTIRRYFESIRPSGAEVDAVNAEE
ncbi:MAG TPA: hypothetical protein VGN57_11300 [Pirellulaceae bacterium]|jgi:hypothetical protein|nr:hypothetical protein [Pirellulaceae bacterium]